MTHSVNLVADELARQVKRHRDKRRRRRASEVQPRPAGP
jgi:ribosome-associated translation inhibitor RaiA